MPPTKRWIVGALFMSFLAVAFAPGCNCGQDPGSDAGTDAGTDAGFDAGQPVDLQILTISDWHGQLDPVGTSADGGQIGGAALLATYFQREKAANPNTLILTAGDAFGASPPLSSFFDEVPAVRALTMMGVQFDTFGNHNFDQGLAHLQRMIDLANDGGTYRYVSSNIPNIAGSLGGVSSPFHIVDVGGVQVGLIGITNDDAASLVFPGRMGNLQIQNSATAAMAAASQARAAGAKLLVALVHMGASQTLPDGGVVGPLIDFAGAVNGFAVIVGDHTDIRVNTAINGAVVVENLSKGREYAKVQLTVVPGTGQFTVNSVSFVTPSSNPSTQGDPDVTAMLAPYRAQLASRFDEKIATATATFPRNGTVERTQEVAIGNLLTDAIRKRYGTELALINGGGIRAPLPSSYVVSPDAGLNRSMAPYDLVVGDIYTVLPFGNAVVTRQITGTQLYAALENGVSAIPGVSGRFPQISGFSFVYEDDAGVGSRVVAATLPDGGLIPRDGTSYSIAVVDFINTGGDGYAVLADGQGSTRDVMAEVVLDEVRDAGTVTPAIEGRITRQ
jgi:5'-nucleotidase